MHQNPDRREIVRSADWQTPKIARSRNPIQTLKNTKKGSSPLPHLTRPRPQTRTEHVITFQSITEIANTSPVSSWTIRRTHTVPKWENLSINSTLLLLLLKFEDPKFRANAGRMLSIPSNAGMQPSVGEGYKNMQRIPMQMTHLETNCEISGMRFEQFGVFGLLLEFDRKAERAENGFIGIRVADMVPGVPMNRSVPCGWHRHVAGCWVVWVHVSLWEETLVSF